LLRQFPFKLEVIEQIIEPIKRKLEAIKPTHENKSVDDAVEFLKAVIELSTKPAEIEQPQSPIKVYSSKAFNSSSSPCKSPC